MKFFKKNFCLKSVLLKVLNISKVHKNVCPVFLPLKVLNILKYIFQILDIPDFWHFGHKNFEVFRIAFNHSH